MPNDKSKINNSIKWPQLAVLIALVMLLCSVFIWTNTKADSDDLEKAEVKIEQKANKVELEKAETRINAKVANMQKIMEKDVKGIRDDVKEIKGKQDQMLIYMLTGKIDEGFKRNLLGRRDTR